MGLFKKKKKVSYTPMGRLGTFTYDWNQTKFTLVVEEITQIADRAKIKLLEVVVSKDSYTKNEDVCLKKCGYMDVVKRDSFNWETDEQWDNRIRGNNRPFMVKPKEEPVKYRMTPLDLGINDEE